MRLKAKVKNGMLTVKVKVSSSYSIRKNEAEIIKTNSIRGLLKPECSERHVINYAGPEGIPMKDFLKRKLSKYDFFNMMYQVIEVVKKTGKYGLSAENILFDMNHVYVNEKTKEILYIYLPIEPNCPMNGAKKFMEQLALQAEYVDEDIDFVAEYINYVNALKTFDVWSIEQYISAEEELVGRRIARNHYTESKQGTGKKGVQAPVSEETEMMEQKPVRFKEIMVNRSNEQDATELLNHGRREEELPPIKVPPTVVISSPRIVNRKTKEVIYIEKKVFRIGKEKRFVDLFLSNEAISRKHADIVVRGGKYYVYDHNSTNHTYVNGKVLPPREEVEIGHGSSINLAGEEFDFYTE